jgi:hypothetical protein
MTMLIGRIEKHGRWWVALCEIVGAFTQGRSRRGAMDNLAEVIELRVDRPRFKATVTELEPVRRDVFTVLIEPSEPAWLAAAVLRYQRLRRGLSLADVASSLGAASRNAYASYEQGQREPTLGKFRELLRAVAPEMALVLEPRAFAATKRAPTRARKAGKAAA